MPVWVWFLIVPWTCICAVWGFLLLMQVRAQRTGLFLTPRPSDELKDGRSCKTWPSVCAVIPARNEGRQLAACLRGVLRQDYPALSVVIVDDRSEDDTATVAEEIARSDARVRLERIRELPSGWLGKSHALWTGSRLATTDWLLFVDVDCTLEPWAVRTAVAESERRGVEMFSLWPRDAAEGFWERMTIPLCAGIIALWFGSDRVNDPGSTLAFANGQFLLFRRHAYERIDGHRSVRNAIIEDVPLAEHARRSGVSSWVVSGRDLVAVRMYAGYAAIRDGWARIYVGALRSETKIALSITWLLFGSLLPFVASFPLGLTVGDTALEGGTVATATWVAGSLCVLHLMLIFIVSYRFWGMGHCERKYLWLYPLSVLVVIRILLRAWWWLAVRRSICWRGTQYVIDGRGGIVW